MIFARAAEIQLSIRRADDAGCQGQCLLKVFFGERQTFELFFVELRSAGRSGRERLRACSFTSTFSVILVSLAEIFWTMWDAPVQTREAFAVNGARKPSCWSLKKAEVYRPGRIIKFRQFPAASVTVVSKGGPSAKGFNSSTRPSGVGPSLDSLDGFTSDTVPLISPYVFELFSSRREAYCTQQHRDEQRNACDEASCDGESPPCSVTPIFSALHLPRKANVPKADVMHLVTAANHIPQSQADLADQLEARAASAISDCSYPAVLHGRNSA